jgi:hypothetical protein
MAATVAASARWQLASQDPCKRTIGPCPLTIAARILQWLGNFTSSEPGFDPEEVVANKLLQWCQDRRTFLARFDLDHNGRIDAREDRKMRVRVLKRAQAVEDCGVRLGCGALI